MRILTDITKIKIFFFFISLLLLVNSCSENMDNRPNIVLIMADDMGTEVLGCYGGKSYKTPNISQVWAQNKMSCIHEVQLSPSRFCFFYSRVQFFFTNSSCASGSAFDGIIPVLSLFIPIRFKNTLT